MSNEAAEDRLYHQLTGQYIDRDGNQQVEVDEAKVEEINKWAILRWRRQRVVGRSKYMPHQGKEEAMRRAAQLAKGVIK